MKKILVIISIILVISFFFLYYFAQKPAFFVSQYGYFYKDDYYVLNFTLRVENITFQTKTLEDVYINGVKIESIRAYEYNLDKTLLELPGELEYPLKLKEGEIYSIIVLSKDKRLLEVVKNERFDIYFNDYVMEI